MGGLFFIDAYNQTISDLCGTITTGISYRNCSFIGEIKVEEKIAIKNNNSKGYAEAENGDGIDISGRMEYHRGTVQKGMAQTINTKGTDGGVLEYERERERVSRFVFANLHQKSVCCLWVLKKAIIML